MREANRTTRERLIDHLKSEPASPSELAAEFDLTPSSILNHVKHVAQSLSNGEEQLLVKPPECRACGFNRFDDPVNLPSRCPDCKSEGITEPAFVIETT